MRKSSTLLIGGLNVHMYQHNDADSKTETLNRNNSMNYKFPYLYVLAVHLSPRGFTLLRHSLQSLASWHCDWAERTQRAENTTRRYFLWTKNMIGTVGITRKECSAGWSGGGDGMNNE